MRRLPSLSTLIAFEAAARHLSFTRAATELNLSQGAISQRIKALEELLGQRLFIRDGSTLRVSEAGTEYLTAVRHLIRDIRGATERAVNRQRGDVLTIGALATFALKCLLPNLGDFRRRYPDIELRIRTPVPFENSPLDDYDLSFQYGSAPRWPQMIAMKLGDEELFPVCSPALLQADPGLTMLTDLSHHSVIRTSSPLVLDDEWPLWLEQAGVPNLVFAGELNCNFLYSSYRAAIEGLGIAMGRTALVRSDVAQGRLVEPFSIRLRSLLGYHIVVAPDRIDLPKIKLFHGWALANLKSELFPQSDGIGSKPLVY